MNKLKIFVIPVILSTVLLSKALIPSNGNSVILEGNNKEYVYYKFGKDGLVINNIKSEYSLDDSVRIKLFIRAITNELNKEIDSNI